MSSTSTNPESPENAQPYDDQTLRSLLLKQVNYYFSRKNIANDPYLVSHMNSELYVPIAIVANFAKIKALTTDINFLMDVMKSSTDIIVDETNHRVRPNFQLLRNTLILREIPSEADEAAVEALLKGDDLPVVKSIRAEIGNTWFITLATEEDALIMLQHLKTQTWDDHPIPVRIKSENLLKSTYERETQLEPNQEAAKSDIKLPRGYQPGPTNMVRPNSSNIPNMPSTHPSGIAGPPYPGSAYPINSPYTPMSASGIPPYMVPYMPMGDFKSVGGIPPGGPGSAPIYPYGGGGVNMRGNYGHPPMMMMPSMMMSPPAWKGANRAGYIDPMTMMLISRGNQFPGSSETGRGHHRGNPNFHHNNKNNPNMNPMNSGTGTGQHSYVTGNYQYRQRHRQYYPHQMNQQALPKQYFDQDLRQQISPHSFVVEKDQTENSQNQSSPKSGEPFAFSNDKPPLLSDDIVTRTNLGLKTDPSSSILNVTGNHSIPLSQTQLMSNQVTPGKLSDSDNLVYKEFGREMAGQSIHQNKDINIVTQYSSLDSNIASSSNASSHPTTLTDSTPSQKGIHPHSHNRQKHSNQRSHQKYHSHGKEGVHSRQINAIHTSVPIKAAPYNPDNFPALSPSPQPFSVAQGAAPNAKNATLPTPASNQSSITHASNSKAYSAVAAASKEQSPHLRNTMKKSSPSLSSSILPSGHSKPGSNKVDSQLSSIDAVSPNYHPNGVKSNSATPSNFPVVSNGQTKSNDSIEIAPSGYVHSKDHFEKNTSVLDSDSVFSTNRSNQQEHNLPSKEKLPLSSNSDIHTKGTAAVSSSKQQGSPALSPTSPSVGSVQTSKSVSYAEAIRKNTTKRDIKDITSSLSSTNISVSSASNAT